MVTNYYKNDVFYQSSFFFSEIACGSKQSKISPPTVASVVTKRFLLNTRDSTFSITTSRSQLFIIYRQTMYVVNYYKRLR